MAQSDYGLARAFAVNPSRQEARPWRASGIDCSAQPKAELRCQMMNANVWPKAFI